MQGLRCGTSRFVDPEVFVVWKVGMLIYCIVWAAWWDRGEDIDIRVYLSTWTHLIATACECPPPSLFEASPVSHDDVGHIQLPWLGVPGRLRVAPPDRLWLPVYS